MDDEQRQQMVINQKTAFSYGEVSWDQGSLSGPATATGWVGYRDISSKTPVMPFMPHGSAGEMCLVVIQDVNEPMIDQEVIEIPFHRLINVRYSPRVL